MSVKLYLDYLSQPCRAIILLMEVSGAPYEEKRISLFKGEHQSEEYARINPMKAVPAMQDGDFRLSESVAILRYLVATRDVIPQDWYPTDVRQRALVDEFIAWHHTGLHRHGDGSVFVSHVVKGLRGLPVDPEEVRTKIATLEGALDRMESVFLSRGDYIVGNTMTLADLLAICELMQPVSIGVDVSKGRPKMAAWLVRVKARLQPHFDEVHAAIIEMGSKFRLLKE